MHIRRKSLLSVIFVAALFGTPALASTQAPGAHGAVDHPLVVPLGTLPLRARLRRRVGSARVRAIARRTGRRVRGAVAGIRAARESFHSRLPLHDSYARGPPHRQFVDVEAGDQESSRLSD